MCDFWFYGIVCTSMVATLEEEGFFLWCSNCCLPCYYITSLIWLFSLVVEYLFMLVLISHSFSYWFCFPTSLWVLRVRVWLQSPVLLVFNVVMIWMTSSANIMVILLGSDSDVSLVYREYSVGPISDPSGTPLSRPNAGPTY